MQAVNAIGHGAFCPPLKVITKSLPPQPPCLECVVVGSNCLKLKWRESRYVDPTTHYILEMQRPDGRSVNVVYDIRTCIRCSAVMSRHVVVEHHFVVHLISCKM